MPAVLGFCRLIDAINDRLGKLVYWLVLAAVLLSAANATFRYLFSLMQHLGMSLEWYINSATAWLELQWYLFAAIFLLCAGYTLLRNEHIRIDVLYGRYSKRSQTWVDILGGLFFCRSAPSSAGLAIATSSSPRSSSRSIPPIRRC